MLLQHQVYQKMTRISTPCVFPVAKYLGPETTSRHQTGDEELRAKFMTLQLAGQPIGLREISRSGKNTLTAIKRYWLLDTPQKTNIEPKKGGLEDYFPFQLGDFQVPCESSRVYAFLKKILYMVSSTHINMDTHHF